MEQELLAMSQRDRDRLAVLREVAKGRLRQRQAGAELGIGERQVRKLARRLREEGDRGIVHRLRGRPSARRIGADVEARAVGWVRERYGDFGPTLASEYLAERHAIRVSRETLRQWLLRAGHGKRRRRRPLRAHVWRPRRARRGELVQWDSSDHAWLEGRGPRLKLLAMIDDATSRLWARFAAEDTSQENLRLLGAYLRRWGRPVAFYTDKAGLFQTNLPPSAEEQRAGRAAETQIGRALRELGIARLAAHSPQAKGRIERTFGTLQNRLVKGLRVAGADSLEAANRYLEHQFLPAWERRFTVLARQPGDAHRPLGRAHRLESILSLCEPRRVNDDYTLRYGGRLYRIPRAQIVPGLRRAAVRVEQRLDGSLVARFRDHDFALEPCRPLPPSPRPAPSLGRVRRRVPNRGWMEQFHLRPPASTGERR